uniref:Uncharacterized protein n=1 Tax=Trichuris muris TaxID=70415 RepID=A0A5S6Q823_TRIMR
MATCPAAVGLQCARQNTLVLCWSALCSADAEQMSPEIQEVDVLKPRRRRRRRAQPVVTGRRQASRAEPSSAAVMCETPVGSFRVEAVVPATMVNMQFCKFIIGLLPLLLNCFAVGNL